MKKFTVITLSAMFCGLVVLSACGGGAASGSAASSDAPLGRVPAIFAEVAAKKKALDESLRKEDDLDRYQKKLKEFDDCLLYTSPSPRDISGSRMPSSA